MHKIMEEDAQYLFSKLDLEGLEGSKVLITGSSGLIGKNLLNLFDAILKSRRYSFEVEAISQQMPSDAYKLHHSIQCKSGNLSEGTNAFNLSEYDYIFHAATYGQPSKFSEKSLETLNLNGPIVIELSKHLSRKGTFVFLSTSEIYSGSDFTPNTEFDLGKLALFNPRAAYVYGKLFGEVALLQMRNEHRIRIGRIALSYGPGTKLDDSRVLNQLIHRGVTQQRVDLLDSGDSIRTYCYVRDTIEMLLRIAFQGSSEIYNVGGISQVSIEELGFKISKILGVPFSRQDKTQRHLDSPRQVRLDISKYESEFGEMNFVGLADGLQRTISWQKSELFNRSES